MSIRSSPTLSTSLLDGESSIHPPCNQDEPGSGSRMSLGLDSGSGSRMGLGLDPGMSLGLDPGSGSRMSSDFSLS